MSLTKHVLFLEKNVQSKQCDVYNVPQISCIYSVMWLWTSNFSHSIINNTKFDSSSLLYSDYEVPKLS